MEERLSYVLIVGVAAASVALYATGAIAGWLAVAVTSSVSAALGIALGAALAGRHHQRVDRMRAEWDEGARAALLDRFAAVADAAETEARHSPAPAGRDAYTHLARELRQLVARARAN